MPRHKYLLLVEFQHTEPDPDTAFDEGLAPELESRLAGLRGLRGFALDEDRTEGLRRWLAFQHRQKEAERARKYRARKKAEGQQ